MPKTCGNCGSKLLNHHPRNAPTMAQRLRNPFPFHPAICVAKWKECCPASLKALPLVVPVSTSWPITSSRDCSRPACRFRSTTPRSQTSPATFSKTSAKPCGTSRWTWSTTTSCSSRYPIRTRPTICTCRSTYF
uniref:(northern house mosquito) hypothetical protein n=1 Tax=Culex pipiens TaxID=7175 RepID=A0A8D8CZK6_CULPI